MCRKESEALMSLPEVNLNTLPHVDGSASYSWQGYRIIGAVNGPLEPQRRDELTEEAYIEVNIRQASGVGGTRERHLETLVHSALRSVVLTYLYPRTLLQLTLQVLATPETEISTAPIPQYASHLPPLPHLLHTAMLSLLSANISLSKTFTAAICAVNGGRRDSPNATAITTNLKESENPSSMHVFAVASTGEMLTVESEGRFNMEELHQAALVAQDSTKHLESWLREIVAKQLEDAGRWKGHPG